MSTFSPLDNLHNKGLTVLLVDLRAALALLAGGSLARAWLGGGDG